MRRFGDNFFIRSDYQEKSGDKKRPFRKNCLFLMKQAMFLAGKDFPVAAKEFNSNEKTFQKKSFPTKGWHIFADVEGSDRPATVK